MAKNKLTLEDVLVPKEEIPYDVPENWCWVKLGSIVDTFSGKAFKKSEYEEGKGVRLLRIQNVNYGKLVWDECEFLPESYIEEESKVSLDEGDIVIALNRPITNDKIKVAMVNESDLPVILYQRVACIRPKIKGMNKNYLLYMFINSYFKDEVIKRLSGSDQPYINIPKLLEIVVPIPPLAEQERLVKRIKSLFEKVDKAKELVEEARDGFEKRRAAILEKAFSGELTKKWREENDVEFNEEKISLSEVVSVNPKKSKLEVDDEQICSFVPMVAVSDINGKIEAMEERPYTKVKKGYTYFEENDVLFAKITPCMENGKSCIAEGLKNDFGFGTTEFHVIRCSEKALNKYIYYLVRAKWFREEAKQNMSGAVGQQRVPKTFLEEYKLWVPSIEEQKEVVRLLEYMLDKEFEVEQICDIDENVELLKKSILGKAFRGELGSNDLKEESSIELLNKLL